MGPDDPIGTVRAGDGVLAVRADTSDPDIDELSWYVIGIGGYIDHDHVEDLIATWPIVYQP